jgi:hypothetical protein
MDESDAAFLADEGWLNASVDVDADEVRHEPPDESGEAPEVHPLAAIRDCPGCRLLGVEDLLAEEA